MMVKEEGVRCFPISEHPAEQDVVEELIAKNSCYVRFLQILQDLKNTPCLHH